MKRILENLLMLTDFVDTETRVRRGKMLIPDIQHGKKFRI